MNDSADSTNVHSLEKLRPLGAFEQFSSARHHLGFMNNVIISASYSSCSSASLSEVKKIIFSALAVVVQRHPSLFAITVDEDTDAPFFARLPCIDLDGEDVVIFRRRALPFTASAQEDVELDQLLEEQHNTPFKTNHGRVPIWRMRVLFSNEEEGGEAKGNCEFVLCFVFHHSMADGSSGMLFHRHFLATLRSPSIPLASHIIYSSTAPLLLNLELLLPPPTTPVASTTSLPSQVWGGAPISIPMHSRFRSMSFNKETSAAFVKACRSHGTTLTSTLSVILARVLMNAIPSITDFECTVPVNIRRWLPQPLDDEVFGVFIDAFSIFHTRTSGSETSNLWTSSQAALETINSYISSYSPSSQTPFNVQKFAAMPSMRAFFLSRLNQTRTSSFDISNLGFVSNSCMGEGEGERDWKVGKMVFSRCAFVSGSAISTSVVTGGDGCLVLGFSWQEGIVEEELVDEVMAGVREEIERFALEECWIGS